MEVATITFAWLYWACAAFYHADRKRSWVLAMRSSPRSRSAARVFGWASLGGSLALIIVSWGWQRGIPAWFALLFLAGMASLFLATLARRAHVASVGAMGVAGTVAGVAGFAW